MNKFLSPAILVVVTACGSINLTNNGNISNDVNAKLSVPGTADTPAVTAATPATITTSATITSTTEPAIPTVAATGTPITIAKTVIAATTEAAIIAVDTTVTEPTATAEPTVVPDAPIATAEPTVVPDAPIATAEPTVVPDTPILTPSPTAAIPSHMETPTPTPAPTATPTPSPTPMPTPPPVPAQFSDPSFCVNRIENEVYVFCEEMVTYDVAMDNVPMGYSVLQISFKAANDPNIPDNSVPDRIPLKNLINPEHETRAWTLEDCSETEPGYQRYSCIHSTNGYSNIMTYNIQFMPQLGRRGYAVQSHAIDPDIPFQQNSSVYWNLGQAESPTLPQYYGCVSGTSYAGCYGWVFYPMAHPLYKKN